MPLWHAKFAKAKFSSRIKSIQKDLEQIRLKIKSKVPKLAISTQKLCKRGTTPFNIFKHYSKHKGTML